VVHLLLQGSTRLDQKAEELLKGLFDGVPWEFERWKKDDPQGYISQVRVVLSTGPVPQAGQPHEALHVRLGKALVCARPLKA
jgi:hypothetical protein